MCSVIFKFQITKEVEIHNNIQKIISKFIKKTSNFFCQIKILSQQYNKNYFIIKIIIIHRHLFNNQSLELSSLSEIDNIIQEEGEIFRKNPTEGLPKVSKLID